MAVVEVVLVPLAVVLVAVPDVGVPAPVADDAATVVEVVVAESRKTLARGIMAVVALPLVPGRW